MTSLLASSSRLALRPTPRIILLAASSSARPIPRALAHRVLLPVYASRRPASTSSSPSSSSDPAETRSLELLDLGTRALEDGDLQNARAMYTQSINVKETSSGWFNLGVCEYHLKNVSAAIEAWQTSIRLSPSADAHTNLASAHILSKPPLPAQAIKHLTSALELSPDDPEIAFNLAAVLESTDNLETALSMYERAEAGGIGRAGQNIRSVSAKILSKKGRS